jgi:VIT1/CCC1 family predicted Fe2+/Mn2+ transporter
MDLKQRWKEHHGLGEDAMRSRIREAVFGVQDGLVSTLGALTGIAAGTQQREPVVIAGLVIIVVESLSMAAGSYLSSKSQREYLERLLREEEEEIAKDPEGERAELWEMYRQRGYTDEEIPIIVNRLMSHPKLLLEDMAHKELGIVPTQMEKPLSNALVMGTAYVAGGLVPVLPYILLPLASAMPVSIGGTVIVLFIFGGLKGRLVRQSWWRSGLEMLAVAGLAAVAGFVVGRFAHSFLP